MIVGRTVLCAILLAAATPVRADQVITLRVPVTLQNLHPEVAKLSIGCYITPTGAYDRTDLPVVNRAFSGTAEVKVKITDAESLSATGYKCALYLFPATGSGSTPTQDLTAGTPLIHAKAGTAFKVAIEGALPPAGATAGQKAAPSSAAPAPGSATPAWGAIGPGTQAAPPGAASRGNMKSALPSNAPSK